MPRNKYFYVVFSINIETTLLKWKWTNLIFFFVKSRLGIFMKKRSFQSLFFIGLMNGLLPCGLVYLALAGAISSGSILGGVVWMVSFGLGTIPLMILAALSGSFISLRLRNLFKKIYPLLLIVFAMLFILRGFQLEIPNDWYMIQLLTGRAFCH